MYTQHQHQKQHHVRKTRAKRHPSTDVSASVEDVTRRASCDEKQLAMRGGNAAVKGGSVQAALTSAPAVGSNGGGGNDGGNATRRKKRRTPKKGAAESGGSSSVCKIPAGNINESGAHSRSHQKKSKKRPAATGTHGPGAVTSPSKTLLSPTHFKSGSFNGHGTPAKKLEFPSPSSSPSTSPQRSPPDGGRHERWAGGSFQNAPQASALPIPVFDDSPARATSSASQPILISPSAMPRVSSVHHSTPALGHAHGVPPAAYATSPPAYFHPRFASPPPSHHPGVFVASPPQLHGMVMTGGHPNPERAAVSHGSSPHRPQGAVMAPHAGPSSMEHGPHGSAVVRGRAATDGNTAEMSVELCKLLNIPSSSVPAC